MSLLNEALENLAIQVERKLDAGKILQPGSLKSLDKITGECPFFVIVTELRQMLPMHICIKGREYLGLKNADYTIY